MTESLAFFEVCEWLIHSGVLPIFSPICAKCRISHW